MNPIEDRLHTGQLENQPSDFPTLYLIPETRYVPRQRAANAHVYDMPVASTVSDSIAPERQSYIQRQVGIFQEALEETLVNVRSWLRRKTITFFRWYLTPLAILACLAIADAAPATLHGG